MLQSNQIKQRFSQAEQAIVQAAKICRSDGAASPELKECLDKLDRQSSRAKQVIDSDDESKIVRCIDELEMLGDQAKQACRSDARANPQLQEAIGRVHDELSNLKHDVH